MLRIRCIRCVQRKKRSTGFVGKAFVTNALCTSKRNFEEFLIPLFLINLFSVLYQEYGCPVFKNNQHKVTIGLARCFSTIAALSKTLSIQNNFLIFAVSKWTQTSTHTGRLGDISVLEIVNYKTNRTRIMRREKSFQTYGSKLNEKRLKISLANSTFPSASRRRKGGRRRETILQYYYTLDQRSPTDQLMRMR